MVRQMGKTLETISRDHVLRYKFASKHLGGRILDAACGVGYGTKLLHDNGHQVIGVDISPDAIAHAHRYFSGPEYIQADITNYLPDRTYTGIVSFETVEHLSNPLPVLRIFRSVCEGLFMASVPNEKHYPFKAEDFDHEYPHQRHYLPEEFDDLMEEADFEVISRHCQISKKMPEVIEGVEGRFLIYLCR